MPGADHFGPIAGMPPAAPVYRGDTLLGYAFLNSDYVNATGYSGKPIHIVLAVALDGTISGARLVDKEPIVLVGIPVEKINRFIAGYVGLKVQDLGSIQRDGPPVDIVSGATVTVMVIGDTIVRSATRIARAKGLGGAQLDLTSALPPVSRTLDLTERPAEDWQTLLGDGSIRRLHISVGEINDAFARSGNAAAAARPEPGAREESFVDLYAALVSQPTIGRSLLGEGGWEKLSQQLEPGQSAILVMGSGRYSFKGSGYVRDGIFDRFEIVQETGSYRFRDRMHLRLGTVEAAGAPRFDEAGLFLLPKGSEFDPTQPWRLQLLVGRQIGAIEKAFLTFDLGYAIPDRFLRQERRTAVASVPAEAPEGATAAPAGAAASAEADEAAEMPLWRRIWAARMGDIVVVGIALAVLTGIFFFQNVLVRRPKLFDRIRLGFLAFTLVWLGWWASAQLSVVNVLTFFNALLTDFRWDYFLVDPLVFILWFSVAASLLFWGRGPFCGWLCPFGALQEFANRTARLLKVPQITVPWGLHERLWPIKYIIFLALFGLSLHSLDDAEHWAEIEPFKTAIVLRFVRDWGFVLFALALVAAGLFIERFFCRYLCPLGAALAIPGRLRMFDWLRRYKECGNPCQRCSNECPVQAIHPEGRPPLADPGPAGGAAAGLTAGSGQKGSGGRLIPPRPAELGGQDHGRDAAPEQRRAVVPGGARLVAQVLGVAQGRGAVIQHEFGRNARQVGRGHAHPGSWWAKDAGA
ncbi:NosR/NirI family protein [Arenibaculum pallidiluteum]|uniref:NosR/NirI family protein n=1 Tax=Arenibaculum pallidiluteum TaxID=2812559 RepID=UPI001F41E212|nr:NosR/NirI family protein [Arenibaculum pallidiluteum]